MAWVLEPDANDTSGIVATVDASKARVAAMKPQWVLEPEAPQGNAITRGYKAIAEPVTKAVSGVANVVTEPLVAASRVLQGEPISQVAHSYNPVGSPSKYDTPALRAADTNARAEGRINPLATAAVPQTPLEAGMMLAAGGAARAAPLLYKQAPALTRILFGAGGGEIGNQLEGGTTGKGALIGAGGAAAGEVAGKGMEIVRRMLPGAKKAISLDDTRRVGQDIADVTGAPPMRTPGDVLDAASGAARRADGVTAFNAAQQEAHQAAVAEARAKAAEATRGGRVDRAAEWQRRQDEYRSGVETATADAERSTTGLQNTVDAMTGAVNTRNREQAATGLHDVINRVSPQLATALDVPGAQGLRNAGAGGARRVIGAGKEEVTRSLEAAAPNGILVPALSDQPMPVRDALWALSEIGAGRGAQFQRNPLDRDILGAPQRMEYGRVAEQIRQGLDAEAAGLGNVFQQGQERAREGFAVTKTLLEPNRNWTPTGEVNVPALATNIVKPRMRRALEDRLGPDRYQDIAGTVTKLPRELGPQRAPRIEPNLPEPPAKPLQAAPVYPDLPAAPTPVTPSAADTVMTALFGPQNRILQGRDTLPNWPAAQKAIQSPRVRAEIEAAVGPDGYQQILKSVLRGATEGADVPARGDGRFLGPLKEWWSGRNPGGGAFASMWHRSVLPNMGAHYVGQKPMQLPPALQTLIDVGMQRGGSALAGDRR